MEMSYPTPYVSPSLKEIALSGRYVLNASNFDPRFGTEYLQGDDDYVM
ncbi:MAG: hypothetical protein K5651_07290 [Bacteroidales bacterium]|nr:hypothetical protein [Bacteroidales bacterium]